MAVERNSMQLQQKVTERTKLLSQLEQAKMQEKVADSLQSMNEVAGGSTPNLDQVREKIEGRYARALGQAELAQNSVQGRMAEVEQAGVQLAGHSRLEQIRAEMAGGNKAVSGGQQQSALGQGQSHSADQQAAQQQAQPSSDAVAQRMRELRGE